MSCWGIVEAQRMLVEVVRALLEGEEAVQAHGLAVVSRRVETTPVCVCEVHTRPFSLQLCLELVGMRSLA